MKYFSYDPNGGYFELWDTEQKAKEAAERALQAEREEAVSYEWSDEVGSICWGELKQYIEETKIAVDIYDYQLKDFKQEKED